MTDDDFMTSETVNRGTLIQINPNFHTVGLRGVIATVLEVRERWYIGYAKASTELIWVHVKRENFEIVGQAHWITTFYDNVFKVIAKTRD